MMWQPGLPPDEFEKLVVWVPRISPTKRGQHIMLARFIHNHGWVMRGDGTLITADSDIAWWMDIPPVPEQEA